MDPRGQLYDDLGVWRRLSEEEGQAIQKGDWDEVERCQRVKTGLQTELTARHQAVRGGLRGRDLREFEKDVAAVVLGLVALERRNLDRVGDYRRKTEARKTDLRQSSRNLRRLHGSYGSRPPPFWYSYS